MNGVLLVGEEHPDRGGTPAFLRDLATGVLSHAGLPAALREGVGGASA